jgi:Tfp pilus assembly protein PilV
MVIVKYHPKLHMKHTYHKKNGLGLTEVIVSMIIITVTWLALTDALVRINSFIPEMRHRVQAMYAAQEIIERWRRKNFTTMASQAAAKAIGSDSSNPCYNFGATYTVTVGAINNHRRTITVAIKWNERHFLLNKPMTEYYATDISDYYADN